MSANRFKDNDLEFDRQAEGLVAYFTVNKVRFKLSDGDLAALGAPVTQYSGDLTDYGAALREERRLSQVKENSKTLANKTLSTAVTNLGALFTNDDRAANEMPLLSGPGTRNLAPTTWPDLMVSNGAPGELMVLAVDANNPTKRGKPDEVDDLELRWDVPDGISDDDVDEWHSGPTPSDLRGATALKFKPIYRGKTINVMGRYRNNGGDGPWSQIASGVVA